MLRNSLKPTTSLWLRALRRCRGLASASLCGAIACGVIVLGSPLAAQSQTPIDLIADQSRNIRDLLSHPGLEAEAKRQQQQNALVAASVKVDEFGKTSGFAAKLDEVFGSIRNGSHNVVSPDGERIVTLIRSLATADPKAREAGLRALKSYADSSAPEAITFIGFASEYGLLGLRRDVNRARSLYLAAANAHYQPALYNAAVAYAYGRGTRVDLVQASAYLEVANARATDGSARVCGLGAFVDDRRNARSGALAFAKGCASPLAAVPRARAELRPLTLNTVEELRRSTSTGIDDAFALIPLFARSTFISPAAGTANSDTQYLYCKYLLVDRYRTRRSDGARPGAGFEHLREDATACYDRTAVSLATESRSAASMRRDQAIGAITGFVPAEVAALDGMRKSNHFHYAWSVPYLPFTQQDANLFEPLMVQAEGAGQ